MIKSNTTFTFTPRVPEEIYQRFMRDRNLVPGAVLRVYWSSVMEGHCYCWSKEPDETFIEKLGLTLVFERVLRRKLELAAQD